MIFGFTLRDTKGKNLVQGGITGAVCVGRDGNDLNQVLAESKRFADGLAGLIDTASAPISGSDLRVRSQSRNRSLKLLSYSEEEAIGQHLVRASSQRSSRAVAGGGRRS